MSSLCPVCGREALLLPHLSGEASYVFYFRCGVCRHIWTVNKVSGHIRHVTPLRVSTVRLRVARECVPGAVALNRVNMVGLGGPPRGSNRDTLIKSQVLYH